MNLKNTILFITPALIWGSTWYAIKFQLGTVDPMLSVAYRFALAGLLLLLFCLLFKYNLRFSLRQHFFIFLQGLSLFGINYWLVYTAENYLTSGLVAVVFSLIIFLNIFFNRILLKGQVKREVVIGAVFGIVGTVLIFKKEFASFSLSDNNFYALFLSIGSVTLASLGNIISAYNQKKNLPVIQTNAFGMTYGALLMMIIALISGVEYTFDLSFSYTSSLIYLTIFGSIIAFTTYLKLLGNIGPDRSAYIILIIPVIAMIISTIFESYVWQRSAIIGIVLLITGNYFALNKKFRTKKS